MSDRSNHRPPDAPLPRGRHSLDAGVVSSHQRRRLLQAAGELLLREGYTSLTVAAICLEAQVSRASFYELFADRLDCLAAAHSAALAELIAVLESGCDTVPAWPDNVLAAAEVGLSWAADSPAAAAPLLLGTAALGTEIGPDVLATERRLAALLDATATAAGAYRPDRSITQAMLGGLAWVVYLRLRDGEADRLPALAPELARFILLPYLGPEPGGVGTTHDP
jgi:AcrR family transcriptional regulator